MIIEMAGRPAEHVKQQLEEHVEQFKNLKKVVLINYELYEPKQVKDKDMYTCFAEVEVECETFPRLIELVFDFMPSSVEILEPSKFEYTMPEATSFLNDLAGRLHKYDQVARIAQLRNQQMANKLKEMQKGKN